MVEADDLLVEIGTEELPPKSLKALMLAFADGFAAELEDKRLAFTAVTPYASPRRLALIVSDLARAQADREVELKGPPVSVAFDADGNPQPAARAFARKCGVDLASLSRSATDKGEWLSFHSIEQGVSAAALLAGMIESALGKLPIARPMRWGDSEAEFVRPVHWVVILHGSSPVDGKVLGIDAQGATRGHRFHAPGALALRQPAEYPLVLENEGYVVADFGVRRERIERAVEAAAAECGGVAVANDLLFDEVTALVEWPVAVTGRFDDTFLALPREVIIATLTSHQRYFPVADEEDTLLPAFVTVANLESKDPAQVRHGNERVIRPRLADAAFFWQTDQRVTLGERVAGLGRVVYQKGLGSIGDRSERIAILAGRIAAEVGADRAAAERAARLAKGDLLTGMVGEFPELQGTMGRYYARIDGEPDAVAEAIGEQYLPRFAGDAIAATPTGQCVAIADKLDSLCGIFALGKRPSGNRDPFGLRRSALGIVRTVLEARLEFDLSALIGDSVAAQPAAAAENVAVSVYDYIIDRMRAHYLDGGEISVEMFESVRERAPSSLLDFDERLTAVAAFLGLDSASSLSAANKRIANILRQAKFRGGVELDAALLTEDAEFGLYRALKEARTEVAPLLRARRYSEALARLAGLRESVDTFFDDVMVMADDDATRLNRLALLTQLREQFLDVADVSRLSIK